MLRKLALSLAVAGALSATQANALGLGAIQVNSALNEPLNAEIKLLQVRDLSPLQIQPRMADIDEFSLAGISKSRFLSDVKFDVKVMPDGTGVISLNSSTPIKEPFLNFLVEVNWPSGRLVREYTLLLDPPLFDPTPAPGAQAVQPARTAAPAPVPAPKASQPVASGTSSAASSQPANTSNIKTRTNPNTEVYVDVDDTLWELALEHRPNRSVTPEQMMLALQRKNPQSFPGGNINMLKAGTVMRLPTLEEIKQLTASEAKAEALRQTDVWRNRGSSSPASEPAPQPAEAAAEESGAAESTVETAESTESQEAGSQLKVVAPVEPTGSDQASAASSDDSQSLQEAVESVSEEGVDTAEGVAETQDLAGTNEELENRLLLTQESVAKVELENTELNDKLDSIVSQLDKMQKLIELKDRELAMLQQQLDQRDEADAEAAGFVDQMLKNPAYLAGAGGAVLLAFLVGMLLARKGKDKEEKSAEEPKSPDAKAQADKADTDVIPDMAIAAAAGAAGAAVAASAVADESEAEQEVQAAAETNLADDDLGDLGDLDLDMDLDLDEAAADAAPTESISDDEFDLGVEELEEQASVADEDLDTGLDDLLAENDSDDELPGALDDDLIDLDLTAEEPIAEPESETEQETDELDFAVDGFGDEESSDEDDLLDLPDDLEFAVNQPAIEDAAADSEADELAGLDFAVDNSAGEESGATEGGDDDLLEGFFDDELEPKDEFSSLNETSEEDIEPLTDDAVEVETPEDSFSLETVEPLAEPDDSAVDDVLDDMLLNSYGDEEEADEAESETAEAKGEESVDEDDLDALLASFEPDQEEEELTTQLKSSERVEEELTANIAHDLETDLDAELDELLDSTDDEIALEEENAVESLGEDDDSLDSLNLLDGADENETKLDLARAYIEMEDRDGAKDILSEILGEGNHFQRREAQRLLDSLKG